MEEFGKYLNEINGEMYIVKISDKLTLELPLKITLRQKLLHLRLTQNTEIDPTDVLKVFFGDTNYEKLKKNKVNVRKCMRIFGDFLRHGESEPNENGGSSFSLLKEWNHIESSFQKEYGIDLRSTSVLDGMSWDRFVVLMGDLSITSPLLLNLKLSKKGASMEVSGERAVNMLNSMAIRKD